jgi:hypothetical protein
MSHKIIEATTHDYDPVNKYIDEKARIKRTKSVWGYTRSLALFLVALGIFFILAAYAYHIYKKPYGIFSNKKSTAFNEKVKKNILGENIVYSSKVTRFDSSTQNGYEISTGYRWDSVDDLRYGKVHVKDWCYIQKNGISYYFNDNKDQTEQLNLLNLTKTETNKYKDYCTN